MKNMYSIAHHTLKLDGVITQFADIYAPLAQVWKNTSESEESAAPVSPPKLSNEEKPNNLKKHDE